MPFANIQSTSGTVSNIAALKALAKPGDSITAVSTADGGHISHARMGAVGLRDLNLSTYPWDEERMEPDIDASADLIRELHLLSPCLVNPCSCFQPTSGVGRCRSRSGSTVMYDGAHVLGLMQVGVSKTHFTKGPIL